MYTLNRLNNPWIALSYQAFTFPKFRPRLEVLKSGDSTVAIAASDSNQPIGLALAEIQGKSAEILSIFVEPNHRSQGIGTALLSRMEDELLMRGCTIAKLVYTTGQPTTPAFERLLEKSNWSQPQLRMLVCKTSNKSILEASWMQRTTLPASYTIFPWVEITQQERIALQKEQEVSAWIPQTLIPFQHEKDLEPATSLGLRYKGQVVGWIITHRLAPDTIRYTCGFVRPDLQKMGRYISLIANAIKLQVKANIPTGIWTVPIEHPAMINFVKKRLHPYISSLKETKGSFKLL